MATPQKPQGTYVQFADRKDHVRFGDQGAPGISTDDVPNDASAVVPGDSCSDALVQLEAEIDALEVVVAAQGLPETLAIDPTTGGADLTVTNGDSIVSEEGADLPLVAGAGAAGTAGQDLLLTGGAGVSAVAEAQDGGHVILAGGGPDNGGEQGSVLVHTNLQLQRQAQLTNVSQHGNLFVSDGSGGLTLGRLYFEHEDGNLYPLASTEKEVFFPAVYDTQLGTVPILTIAAGATGYVGMAVPNDFATAGVLDVKLVMAPSAGAVGAAKDIDFAADFGGIGQAYNTHNTSDAASTYTLNAADTWQEIDLTTLFNPLTPKIAAGDQCGLSILPAAGIGGAVYIRGIRLRYKTKAFS